MKKYKAIVAFIILLNCLTTKAQVNTWLAPCLENEKTEGRLPLDYSIKKFPKTIDIEIKIKKLEIGTQVYLFDFNYRKKINYETDLLKLNDTLAVRLFLASTIINAEKQYLYSFNLYKYKEGCWRSLSTKTYSSLWSKQITLSGGGVGYPGDKDYFRYVDGLIILHP